MVKPSIPFKKSAHPSKSKTVSFLLKDHSSEGLGRSMGLLEKPSFERHQYTIGTP
jgi:hypothetical protein